MVGLSSGIIMRAAMVDFNDGGEILFLCRCMRSAVVHLASCHAPVLSAQNRKTTTRFFVTKYFPLSWVFCVAPFPPPSDDQRPVLSTIDVYRICRLFQRSQS